MNPINILLVEDSPSDIRLTKEALKECEIPNVLHVVTDGEEAMEYIRKKEKYSSAETPDLVLLDINLPKKSGRSVLAEIKSDEELKTIPVIMLTTSSNKDDIHDCYGMHANCYIIKPIDLHKFMEVVKSIEDFWLTMVKLPGVAS